VTGNRHKDFLHKASASIVKTYGLIATEALNVNNMTAAGGEFKKGLNRSTLDTARKVKSSRTCHRCGVQRKKLLSERHKCECGANCSRDENAAKVMLNWALTGSGQELSDAMSRDVSVLTCETHLIAA
jgi:putative transposase